MSIAPDSTDTDGQARRHDEWAIQDTDSGLIVAGPYDERQSAEQLHADIAWPIGTCIVRRSVLVTRSPWREATS